MTMHSGQCLPCDEYRYDALVYLDDVMVSTIENHFLLVLVVKRAEQSHLFQVPIKAVMLTLGSCPHQRK